MGSASLGPVSLSSKALVEKSAQSSPYREASGNKTVRLTGRPEGTPARPAGCCLLKSCSSREGDKITRWPQAVLGISGVGKDAGRRCERWGPGGMAHVPKSLLLVPRDSSLYSSTVFLFVLCGVVLLQKKVIGHMDVDPLACMCPGSNTTSPNASP